MSCYDLVGHDLAIEDAGKVTVGGTVVHSTAITKPNVSLRQEIEGEFDNFDGLSLSAGASIQHISHHLPDFALSV